MKTVKVQKERLREALEANRDTHVKDYELAVEGFRRMARDNLEARLDLLNAADDPTQVEIWINLRPPENHEEDYVRAMEMLEWELEEDIELTEQEFQELVQDDWNWKGAVMTSNVMYTGSSSPSRV